MDRDKYFKEVKYYPMARLANIFKILNAVFYFLEKLIADIFHRDYSNERETLENHIGLSL